MKFGIITLVSDNYGNKYQNYAVERILSEYGDVETYGLDNLYHALDSQKNKKTLKISPRYIKEVLISRPMYKYDINRVDKGIIRNFIYAKKNSSELLELKKIRSERFNDFAKKNLHISDKVLNRDNVGKDWSNKIDYFFCGSDQIWNPNYATTSELAFCSFAPEKTICLSPSFGVSEIPECRKKDYMKWLKNIKTLSVREMAGKKMIKDLTGRDCNVFLDPTMLLDIKEWEKLCKEPNDKLPEHYVACYFLGRVDKNYYKKIKDFAREKKLPIVMLFDITTPQYYVLDPAEVLYTIKHADYVLTDSFHGAVFSILFHNNFYVFTRNEGKINMNSRIETLLHKFSLEDRLFERNEKNISIEQWSYVEKILYIEKKKTISYIENAININ